jgi:hypothetical protein
MDPICKLPEDVLLRVLAQLKCKTTREVRQVTALNSSHKEQELELTWQMASLYIGTVNNPEVTMEARIEVQIQGMITKPKINTKCLCISQK